MSDKRENEPEQNACAECGEPATWKRVTQFSGSHYYCGLHASKESDFGTSDSYQFWKKVKR